MGDSGHRSPLVVVVVLLVAAVACSGGDDDTAGRSDRCDRDVNTARFDEATAEVDHAGMEHDHDALSTAGAAQVDFTVEQWADTFADPDLGMSPVEVAAAVDADVVYRRHVLAGVLTHTLDPDPWLPLTDPATCDALGAELDEVRGVVDRFPTVADALAAGYDQGDVYYAGLGVHYQHWGLLGDFDPGRPVQLLYDGTDPGSTLVGLSYVVTLEGDVAPEGFTGDNDQWHRHDSWCLDQAHGSLNLAADVLTPEECAALGGTHMPNTSAWMLHVWVVPGCESDWGIFSSANPRLPYIPASARLVSGCTAGSDVSLASSG